MPLTIEEREYLEKHPMVKKLTVQMIDEEALWNTEHGARTLSNAVDMEKLAFAHNKRLVEEDRNRPKYVSPDWSEEMELRHQRCIDEFGCGLEGD